MSVGPRDSRTAMMVGLATIVMFAQACANGGEGSSESDGAGAVETEVSSGLSDGVAVSGVAPPASRGFRSVIAFVPKNGPPVAAADTPGMDQFSREFYPDVLTAAPGQEVEFANSEEEMHNVHVRGVDSGDTIFNVGTPAGASYKHRFDTPGAYHVTCDVHSEMEAFLIVAPGRVVKAAKDGAFELDGLPAGEYGVLVWNAASGFASEQSVVLEGPSVSLDVRTSP